MHRARQSLWWPRPSDRLEAPVAIHFIHAELERYPECTLRGEVRVESARPATVGLVIELLRGQSTSIDNETCVLCQTIATYEEPQLTEVNPGKSRTVAFEIRIEREVLPDLNETPEGDKLYALFTLTGADVPPGMRACVALE